MKKLCLTVLAAAFVTGGLLTLFVGQAQGYLEFRKGFKKKYIDEGGGPKVKELETAFDAAKCNVCHDPTKKDAEGKASKKNRNPYGEELHKHLGKKDKKDAKKILEALEKLEPMKAPGATETYGERIKAGKLPIDAPPAVAEEDDKDDDKDKDK